MTPEDQKARDEFEAWRVGEFVSSARRPAHVLMLAVGEQKIAEYAAHPDFIRWVDQEASRRTYRATLLEEAAQVAKRGIGSGALSALEEYRAKFIEDELRALASPPPCTGRNCSTTTANHSPECVADHLRAVAGKE